MLSGGLDSATTLYHAKDKGYQVLCLIFDYKQRHRKEIACAKKVAQASRSPFKVVPVSLPGTLSSLLNEKIRIPKRRGLPTILKNQIPSTYVPARNIIFLGIAASWAETIGAQAIFIGANARDYSGYPDCRPQFYKAFSKALVQGMKASQEGRTIQIKTPLIRKTKAQIIKMGLGLKVPYHLTWSCYQGRKIPCGQCDSCLLREKGFQELKVKDPLLR